jgi:hypothetical protein
VTSLPFSRGVRMAVGALVCLSLAVGLGLLAVDVGRWRDAMLAGDIRYRGAPREADLWVPATVVPLGAAEELLGVEDDLAFRRAVRALRLARLRDTIVSDPAIALARNEAQTRLEAIASGRGEPTRRSRAANLLGVLGLARLITEAEDRAALLESTLASLELALALDPGNDEAKFNLELALQRSRGSRLTESSSGSNPSPGGTGAKGAGAGQPGSGY